MNTVYVLFGGVMLLTLIGYTIAMTLKDILAELRLLREGQNTTTPKDTP